MSVPPVDESGATGYDDFTDAAERDRMVETQIISRGVHDRRVLEAMRSLPRHVFVPPEHRYLAYSDGALPIGSGQTISQPYIVALMTELLELEGDEKVLEIGTGSGYQAAILSTLASEVHTIERHAGLARYAARLLDDLKIANVQVHVGDGTLRSARARPLCRHHRHCRRPRRASGAVRPARRRRAVGHPGRTPWRPVFGALATARR